MRALTFYSGKRFPAAADSPTLIVRWLPAFASAAGGWLTEKQIDAITEGIRTRWSRPGILDGAHPPSYTGQSAGDPQRGQGVFKTYCEACHGAVGVGGPKGSTIANDSFLALISDQGLRSIVIAGRPDEGMPDWHSHGAQPMTDQQVTDVVAWLGSKRSANPGQPYPTRP